LQTQQISNSVELPSLCSKLNDYTLVSVAAVGWKDCGHVATAASLRIDITTQLAVQCSEKNNSVNSIEAIWLSGTSVAHTNISYIEPG